MPRHNERHRRRHLGSSEAHLAALRVREREAARGPGSASARSQAAAAAALWLLTPFEP